MSESAATNYEFRAETRKVLNILTHSLYTNREIFLRELISNASDALDKVRFLQGRGEAVRHPELPLEVRIRADKVQNCLFIEDSGVGMTREELIENLGTIARSGSEAFLADVASNAGQNSDAKADGDGKTGPDATSIIGRFGIGFYSVFMVADKVEVVSRTALGDAPAQIWSSDGTGVFTVAEAPDADLVRGTQVRVFLKEDAHEFLEKYRLEGVIRKHSAFIGFPIFIDGERYNTTPALWREPKFSLTKEQYAEFYSFLTYDQTPPLDTLHFSSDAPVQFSALLFVPDQAQDRHQLMKEHWGLDLYVRRVLIQRENKTLLPEYLGFFKGVVDTEDLPLNISRETLQENLVLRKISQTLTKQAFSHLEKMSSSDPALYERFWNHHGCLLKLGYSDFVNKDRLVPLLRFNTSTLPDATSLASLDDYVSRMKEGQKEIWYLAAPSRDAAKLNPQLEGFTRKGLEVLFLYEPVDEFALETLGTYKDFTFKAVEHADKATLDAFADTEERTAPAPLSSEGLTAFEGLLVTIRNVLSGQIKDVRVSHRLTDSPACLVAADEHVTSSMDRIMRVLQKDDSIPLKIFEVNRDHPLLRTLSQLNESNPTDPQLMAMIQSLFDATLLLDGFVKDPHALAGRMTKLVEQAGAWYSAVKGA